MPPKLDTSIKATTKAAQSRPASANVFNEDLMAVLNAFKVEFLSSSKALSNLQATQYKDLKADSSCVCTQVAELKAKNFKLRGHIDALKDKVASLESFCSGVQSQSVVTQVIQESF